ncbi:CobW family GTP-binding protein [Bacillus sp. DJP31]|uniref:CobW family GTP-binding protein n=1 Tax=Bacillus sp. DJP31 TaxID=3409789 RepID=UPI003BB53B81
MNTSTKIPVYVLNGFLGSGKTTVLINILSYCKEKELKAGVILNELGETNVEGHLLGSEQIVELLNGCICCTIQEDLKSTLDDFIRNQKESPVDLLIIEGTGVANPLELIEALTDQIYVNSFELQSIIGMVDASQYLDYQSIFTSSKEVRKLLQDQIQYSTLLLVNKTDLLSTSKLEKVEKQIRKSITNDIPIIHTAFAKVDREELFKKRFFMIDQGHKHCDHNHEHGESCDHHHHHNHAMIKAIKLDQLPVLDRISLEKWYKNLPKEIIRSKGIVQLEGTSGFFDFQFASRRLTLTQLAESPKVDPSIVIIGADFDEEKIMDSFSKTFLQVTRI